jgi:NAD-dependent SIR2 family protein deacetylase
LLVQTGLVKHVVTQNVDGLHRESGVPEGKLTELHGNGRKERCEECGREYLREYPTWSVTSASGEMGAFVPRFSASLKSFVSGQNPKVD